VRKPPEIFIFIILSALFGEVIGERKLEVDEARVVFEPVQADEQIWALRFVRPLPRPAFFNRGRLQSQARPSRKASKQRAWKVRSAAGGGAVSPLARGVAHLGRPGLVGEGDQRLEFAQGMGVAEPIS
jgi:hypothetical protein